MTEEGTERYIVLKEYPKLVYDTVHDVFLCTIESICDRLNSLEQVKDDYNNLRRDVCYLWGGD